MPKVRSSTLVWTWALWCGSVVGPVRGDQPATDAASRVREILADKCLGCHATETKKGGLDLSRRASALHGGKTGPALVSGKPGESLLVERLEAGEMPPGRPLKPEEIETLRSWVESGAAYDVEPLLAHRAGPDWWSLRPIERAAIPPVKRAEWVRTPVDAFILDRLERDGLSPAPPADRAAFLRRVSFDLIGLPPTPEEIDAFVHDQNPDAFERLVDRLLSGPRYGERWGRHWLDVVRFAESQGYETNELRRDAWPYRDYVIRSFNQDTPFARFVAEQLAGDILPDADWLTRSATGFLVAGSHDIVGNQVPEAALQQRHDDLDDIIAATSTAFLGLTVQCARCHDHKFDPITQRDYYGLQACLRRCEPRQTETIPRDDPESAPTRGGSKFAANSPGSTESWRTREPIARLDHLGPSPIAGQTRPGTSSGSSRSRPVSSGSQSGRRADGSQPCIDELEVWSSRALDRRNVASSRSRRASHRPPRRSRDTTSTGSSTWSTSRFRQRAKLDLQRARPGVGLRSS